MEFILKNLLILVVCVMSNSILFAAGVCFHCEEIRENNRLHPHNYEYYEDYLNEQNQNTDKYIDKTSAETKPQKQ